jgi:hypothetical protein
VKDIVKDEVYYDCLSPSDVKAQESQERGEVANASSCADVRIM